MYNYMFNDIYIYIYTVIQHNESIANGGHQPRFHLRWAPGPPATSSWRGNGGVASSFPRHLELHGSRASKTWIRGPGFQWRYSVVNVGYLLLLFGIMVNNSWLIMVHDGYNGS